MHFAEKPDNSMRLTLLAVTIISVLIAVWLLPLWSGSVSSDISIISKCLLTFINYVRDGIIHIRTHVYGTRYCLYSFEFTVYCTILKWSRLTTYCSWLTSHLSAVTFWLVFAVSAPAVKNGMWYSVNIILNLHYSFILYYYLSYFLNMFK